MMKPGRPILNLALESDSSEEDEDIEDVKSSTEVRYSPRPFDNKKIEYESSDFLESRKSIAENPWNLNSWNSMIEEIENGRGGTMGVAEAYAMATDRFPRAACFWKKLLQLHLQNEDMQACEDGFRNCLQKCRNVDLWNLYLSFMSKKTVEKEVRCSENYANAERAMEAAFEEALDSVGMASDSHVLWRRYLDFILEWPEQGMRDSGMKVSALRAVYQRAVCTAMEDLDRFWQEYEELEMRAGEHLDTQLLPEFKPKNQHARAVFRNRMNIISKIQQGRVATPPSSEGSVAEMEQLELWNKWISFEMENPEFLTEEKHRGMMRMVFDKCLNCFYLHPEVWITLSRYVLGTGGAAEAREVLKDALDVNPQVPTLWFALAEFEELHDSLTAAVSVLRTAFEVVPCAFTFAALQRLVRRKDGKIAARKLFTETKNLRSDGTLGYEVYVAHALLEVEVNNEPQVALKVLEMAKARHPVASNNAPFLKLMVTVLVRLGDVMQLRWVFQTALGAAGSVEGSAIASGVQRQKAANGFSQEEQLELWQAFLEAELTLGMSDVTRLSELRAHVEALKSAMRDRKKSGTGDTAVISCDIFDSVVDIFSRCTHFTTALSTSDEALRQRARGSAFLVETTERADHLVMANMDGPAGSRRRGKPDSGNIDSATLAGAPIFLRELLLKLPPHKGSPPNVDAFLEQLKKIVLPPRPVTDGDAASSNGVVAGAVGEDVSMAISNKRGLLDTSGYDDDNDDTVGNVDDVFSKRRRLQMTSS